MALSRLGKLTANSAVTPAANYKWVSRVTVGGSPFTFIRGAAYGYNQTYATAKSRMVVYAADGTAGAPGTLVAQSNERVGIYAYQWNDYVFPSAVTLSASTNYYIGIIIDTQMYFSCTLSSGTNYYNADTYSDGAANPWGTATTNTNEFCGYIAGPANEEWVGKVNGLAVLGTPDNAVSVAKEYGLAVLTQEPRIAVAKAYGLAILDTNIVNTQRPTVMVCT